LVVIDAVDFEASTIKIDANFRTDQAGRACNKCFFHRVVSALWINFYDTLQASATAGLLWQQSRGVA